MLQFFKRFWAIGATFILVLSVVSVLIIGGTRPADQKFALATATSAPATATTNAQVIFTAKPGEIKLPTYNLNAPLVPAGLDVTIAIGEKFEAKQGTIIATNCSVSALAGPMCDITVIDQEGPFKNTDVIAFTPLKNKAGKIIADFKGYYPNGTYEVKFR